MSTDPAVLELKAMYRITHDSDDIVLGEMIGAAHYLLAALSLGPLSVSDQTMVLHCAWHLYDQRGLLATGAYMAPFPLIIQRWIAKRRGAAAP